MFSTTQPIPVYAICPLVDPALCEPLACLLTMTSASPNESPSFYALSDIVPSFPSPLCVTISILDPADYRSKRLVSLASAHNHYYLGTHTSSTRRMYPSIENDDFDTSASQHDASTSLSLTKISTFQWSHSLWIPFPKFLPPSVHLS